MNKIEFVVNKNGCHVCTSHFIDKDGYPRIHQGRLMSRFLWKQKYGLIPEGLCVCHKCDTPSCINIEHFFLGTRLENVQDMDKKGRRLKGKEVSNSKLTEEQVLQIRNDSDSTRKIAKKYGVSQYLISLIKRKKRWAWL